MISKIKYLADKYNETLFYLFYGGLTVIVNIVSFVGLNKLGMGNLWANTVAFFIAVQFAYFTNTKYVFKAELTRKNFVQFWGMRISTIFIDNLGMLLLLRMDCDKVIAKILVNGIIIILNYIFSKFVIYRKKR